MSKLGVGIGEDFPVDDPKPAGESASGAAGNPNDPEYEARREEWRRQREEWRQHRDEWRARRRQWREEWRARRHAFHEEMRARYGDDYSKYANVRGHRHGIHLGPRTFMHLLVLVGLIGLTIFVFNHLLFVLFGLVVLGGLFAAYHGGFDHFDMMAHHGPRPPSPPPSEAPKA